MSCFSGVSKLSRCEILALVDSFSVALSDGLSNDDINALGNLIVAIGGVMLSFAAQVPNQTAGSGAETQAKKC